VGSIGALPITIVSGGEADVTLTYQPSSLGDAKATVQILGDDPRQTCEVQVNGWGM